MMKAPLARRGLSRLMPCIKQKNWVRPQQQPQHNLQQHAQKR
jgi:hypothetical protein